MVKCAYSDVKTTCVQDRGTLKINEWFATRKPESLNSCALIQKRKNERKKKKNKIGFMAFSLCQDPSDICWCFLKTGGMKFRPVWNKSR